MVQYYTLEEAAQLLQIPADQLKEMVKRNEIRAFQDRGTLRFRRQEVDELVRSRGLGSDPVLQLGDSAKPAGGPPSSGTRRKSKAVTDESTSKLAADDKVSLGEHPPAGAKKSGQSSGSGSGGVGKRKTVSPKSPAPRSPYPKGASDSDVRLVSDPGDLDFHLAGDEAAPAKSKAPEPPKSAPRKKSQLPPPAVSESQVPKMPETSSDSDVKLEGAPAPGGSVVPVGQQGAKAPSDSDIRLEDNPLAGPGSGKKRDEGLITEEIDLDAEAANIEAARKKSKMDKAAKKPPAVPPLPTSSPFELSENEIDVGAEPEVPAEAGKKHDSSGDFELTAPDDSSPLELSSDELPKLPSGSSEEEVTLGELTGAGAGASGINIQDPGDSGISLEGSEDEIEFDLSLDAGATPKPAKSGEKVDAASSEFELSLPDEEGLTGQTSDSDSEFELSVAENETRGDKPPDSDSEFELTLDEEGSSELELDAEHESSSDSEFELTLDEEGGLTALDESSSATGEEEGKDIFETDFDVPALDEESGSEAVGTDGATDLEDSEFELDLETAPDEETGSEDFADDEEEVAPKPKRKTKMTRARAADVEDDVGLDISLDDEDEQEEEVEPEPAVSAGAAAAPPAEWGPLPALVLLPSVIVLIIVGLMGFELVQGMWGFHKPSPVSKLVIDPIARLFDDTLPKE
jgi:excisionase family DNA binding protein